MKKLTDVYIKVTKQNYEELKTMFNANFIIRNYIHFFQDLKHQYLFTDELPTDKQKVSLTELKRLIDTIPTREELKRLKQQISAIRMNYDKVVKHSLSKEDVIEKLDNAVVEQKKIITRQINEIHNLKESRDKWIALGEKLTKENDMLSNHSNVLEREIKVLLDNFDKLKQENEQLKNRKFWQIWKN